MRLDEDGSMSLSICKEFWDRHDHDFPRDIGKYRQGQTKEDYYEMLLKNRQSKNFPCYSAVYSNAAKTMTHTVDRLYYDIDSPEKIFDATYINRNWLAIQDFIRIFWDYLDVYFSGRKGFALYMHVQPISVEKIDRKALLQWLTSWVGDPTIIDTTSITEIKKMTRLSRVPLSYHEATKLQVLPVHYSMTTSEIIAQSRQPTDAYLVPFLAPKKQWNIEKNGLPDICELL
jgi:hypothetical protein